MASPKSKAKATKSFSSSYREKSKISRPGIHAKTKSSKLKKSKNYKKKYRGQGR